MKNWHDDYPRTEIVDYDTAEFRTITIWDVARGAMARCFHFGLRDQADPFVPYEMDVALHCAGISNEQEV